MEASQVEGNSSNEEKSKQSLIIKGFHKVQKD
jgi:hypothetical protein